MDEMTTMTPVDSDDPLMVAWNAYQRTKDYENTLRWAKNVTIADRDRIEHPHVEGSLWAAFLRGWEAAKAKP